MHASAPSRISGGAGGGPPQEGAALKPAEIQQPAVFT